MLRVLLFILTCVICILTFKVANPGTYAYTLVSAEPKIILGLIAGFAVVSAGLFLASIISALNRTTHEEKQAFKGNMFDKLNLVFSLASGLGLLLMLLFPNPELIYASPYFVYLVAVLLVRIVCDYTNSRKVKMTLLPN